MTLNAGSRVGLHCGVTPVSPRTSESGRGDWIRAESRREARGGLKSRFGRKDESSGWFGFGWIRAKGGPLTPEPVAPAKAPAGPWSGRLDSNQRPPAPKAGALPGCATPRLWDSTALVRPSPRHGPKVVARPQLSQNLESRQSIHTRS